MSDHEPPKGDDLGVEIIGNMGVLDEAVATIRAAAAAYPRTPRMGMPTRSTVLAVAMIEEINADWDERVATAPPAVRAIYDKAIEMCKTTLGSSFQEMHRGICAPTTGPAVYSEIRRAGLVDPWSEPKRFVAAVQPMLAGARPLWSHFIPMAQRMIEGAREYEDMILAEASAIQQRRTEAEFAEHQERVAK